MNRAVLWLAQGFGLGRIPLAPGTFGSLLGLGWFALTLECGQAWLWLLLNALATAGAVWVCENAARQLGRPDPTSVVLDEVCAVPWCFAASTLGPALSTGTFPTLSFFFARGGLILTATVFVSFRVFDILKPWPLHSSQGLPGGWGIVLDDLLAALYVNLISGAVFLLVR